MRLPDFKVEQWMNDYENDAVYNLTDTCVKALTLQELLDLESLDFKGLTLDYGQITGDIDLKKAILTLYKHGTVDNVTTAQVVYRKSQNARDFSHEMNDVCNSFSTVSIHES